MKKAESPVVDMKEVEERVTFWYKNRVEMGLHEFLGWTREQLDDWNASQKVPRVG